MTSRQWVKQNALLNEIFFVFGLCSVCKNNILIHEMIVLCTKIKSDIKQYGISSSSFAKNPDEKLNINCRPTWL